MPGINTQEEANNCCSSIVEYAYISNSLGSTPFRSEHGSNPAMDVHGLIETIVRGYNPGWWAFTLETYPG